METQSPEPRALVRARADLAAGRPDRARDRLTGFLYTLARRAAYREDAYALLGEVHAAMQDLPRAGAAWLLTTREGPEIERAVAAFHARYGHENRAVLHALKPRAPSEAYPPAVQARLLEWGYRFIPYHSRKHPMAAEPLDAPVRGVRPVEVGCALFALGLATFGTLLVLRLLRIL